MDRVTVSRELLRQVAEWSHLSNGPEQLYHLQKALRAALEQSVVKPDNLQCKSVQEPEIAGYVNPTSLSVMRIGEFDWIKLYPDNTGGHIPLYTEPQAQTQPPILTEVEVERLTVFAGLHDIETPLLAEFIRAIERVVRRQFRQTRTAPQAQQPAPVQEPVHKLIYPGGGKALFDMLWHLTCNAVATQSGMRVRTDVMPMREMKEFLDYLCVLVDSPPQPVPAPVPAPVQEPIGWSITCNGGHTGNFFPYRETAEATLIELNRKYPTDKRTIEPLFAAQPSKAVKLSDDEISTIAIDNPPNVHIYARAIEQAVLKANGIEP